MTERQTPVEPITIEVHARERTDAALEQIAAGLTSEPRNLSPRFFYDDVGSQLFEKICTQPEYYQTRTEESILRRRAAEIVQATGARDLIELGSGAAVKTRVLLDAMHTAGQLRQYVPFDVNEFIVRRSAEELIRLYPELSVHGVIGDFVQHLPKLPDGDRRLIIFLGGTLGNFAPPEAHDFLAQIADAMSEDDALLLGTDLVKDPAVLNAAYNDAAGVTADFNLNILNVVNRAADGDFDPSAFEHRAFYDEKTRRIEMWVRSLRDQTVHLRRIPLRLDLEKGEEIRTEISAKFDRPGVETLLGSAGLKLERWLTDDRDYFGLSLSRRISIA